MDAVKADVRVRSGAEFDGEIVQARRRKHLELFVPRARFEIAGEHERLTPLGKNIDKALRLCEAVGAVAPESDP